jgi:thiosulfate/3-mercaptopyruvate sulfurtransferase
MVKKTVISCRELQEVLHHPDLVIVDCRFDLAVPDWGYEEYQALHIPGAVYADLDSDLSGPKTPLTGRHPLPQTDDFCRNMSRLGIDSAKRVVVYDATSGSYAARLWFLLQLFGHSDVSLLDGGFIQWHQEGYPIESGVVTNSPVEFIGTPDMGMLVSTTEIEKLYQNPEWLVIDARAEERYRGELEPIDPVAGRIPGAVNRFHGLNIDSDGLFHSRDRLHAEFTNLLAGHSPEKTAVYCGSGVTSCHHLVAMAYAGLPLPKLYLGSWSEWIRDTSHPIAKG